MSSPIHFRKTGVTVFSARLVSAVTGLAFLLMLTRSLTTSDFGLWEFIVDLVAFASYPAGLVAFWTTRRLARGLKLGTTAIVVSLILSIAGLAFFFVTSIYLHTQVGSAFSHFVLAAALVPLSYLSVSTNAIVSGYKPAVSGYSLISSEVCKVVTAYLLLITLRMGVDGVIGTMAVTYSVQSLVNAALSREALGSSVEISEGRRWLLNSWVPALSTLAYTVNIADTFVASLVVGTALVGYYQAAFSVATIVTYSSYLSTALYPMLLAGAGSALSSAALDFTLIFGIPMAVGSSVLAKPILFLLKPGVYTVADQALVLLSFWALAYSISGVVDYTLLGLEKVDTRSDAAPADYVKSNLTFVPIVNFLFSLLYLGVVYLVLALTLSAPTSLVLSIWAAGQLIVMCCSILVKARRVLKHGSIELPRNLPLYVGGSAAMALLAYALSSFIDYSSRSLVLGLELFATVSLSAAFYFSILYILDSRFRQMVRKLLFQRGG